MRFGILFLTLTLLGAFEYLRKPVPIDKLVKIMRAAYKKKLETSMVAATFAQAGEFDTAREIMKKEEKE
ncbi:MAG: hypothetical protein P8182_10750 [Deltaproteobacteria bacterium]